MVYVLNKQGGGNSSAPPKGDAVPLPKILWKIATQQNTD
jgi:hypothetical protein